jgi:hypothetical protein
VTELRGFRPSDYFGAVDVEVLQEEGVDNSRLDCNYIFFNPLINSNAGGMF